MAGIALVIDRAWIDNAQVELQTAAEAAALAGAGALVDDDLLRSKADTQRRIDKARDEAVRIGAENRVAGERLVLREGSDGDVRVGRLAFSEEDGIAMFLETDRRPQTVVVTARLSRGRGNPLALFMAQITGQPGANLTFSAEATADNHVIGVRPLEGIPIPAFPIAILANDPTGKRQDTWHHQIVKRLGKDEFGFDETTGDVNSRPDGIPEITLCWLDTNDKTAVPNVRLIDLGNELRGSAIARQISKGLFPPDLRRCDGEIVPSQQPVRVGSSAILGTDELAALRRMTGEVRICLLYLDETGTNGQPAGDRVQCIGLVAGRVMQVNRSSGKAPRIIFQPGVLTTRTAIIAGGPLDSSRSNGTTTNDYIYKLSLTQ